MQKTGEMESGRRRRPDRETGVLDEFDAELKAVAHREPDKTVLSCLLAATTPQEAHDDGTIASRSFHLG